MTAPGRHSVPTARSSRPRSNSKGRRAALGANVAVVAIAGLITATGAIIARVSVPTPTPTPTSTSTSSPDSTSVPTLSVISNFAATQVGSNSFVVNGAVSGIPSSSTVWLVARPNDGKYYPVTPITINQTGIFSSNIFLGQSISRPTGFVFFYAVLCDPSANLIFKSAIQGIPTLPSGAVILAVTQLVAHLVLIIRSHTTSYQVVSGLNHAGSSRLASHPGFTLSNYQVAKARRIRMQHQSAAIRPTYI
jgi:hypothetical protein